MTLEELTDFRLRDQLCGGGDEEGRYEVFVPADHERLCQLNLNTPRIADWLWVYKAMFTVLGVHLPFSPFQMALLNRCDVTPSQLYPNSWATIRCFEMVCEYLELPASVEVFLWLFALTNPSRRVGTRRDSCLSGLLKGDESSALSRIRFMALKISSSKSDLPRECIFFG
ncbi:uncharacterized protein LOC110270322 [Arachis ipaensis]|uniref:uncharacterized protein LOC110270322 n=1 Tax=Arachis ipaensis TaxID=130454 RepID=UPI000A2B1A96|nr:uncharacterized protein LOC110270322 [Arachis ipaensis]